MRLTALLSLLLSGLPLSAQLEPGQPTVVPGGEAFAPLVDERLTTLPAAPVALAFARDGSGVFALDSLGRLSAASPDLAHSLSIREMPGSLARGALHHLDDGSLLFARTNGEVERLRGNGEVSMLRSSNGIGLATSAGDAESLAIAMADGTIQVWSAREATGGFQRIGALHDARISALDLRAGRLAIGRQDGRVFTVATVVGEEPRELALFDAPIQALSWIDDSGKLYALTRDGRLHRLDATSKDIATQTWSAPFPAEGMRVTADRKELVLFAPNLGRIGFWDLTYDRLRAEEFTQPAPPGSEGAFALSPTDGTLVTASGPHLRWRRLESHEPRLRSSTTEAHATASSAPSTGALAGDGSRLAIGAKDGTIRVWDTRTGAVSRFVPGSSLVLAMAFAPDDSSFAVTRESGTVEVHDLTGGDLRVLSGASERLTRDLAFLPSGELVAAGGDGQLRVLAEDEVRTFEAHEGPCRTITLAANDSGASFVASGGDDGRVRIFAIDADKRLKESISFEDGAAITDVVLRAGASEVVSADAAGFLRHRRIADGELLRSLGPMSSAPRALALTEDESLLLVLLEDGTVLRVSLLDETGPVPIVRSSSGGLWLDIVAGDRFFVRLTQTEGTHLIEQETGRTVRRFPGDAGAVRVLESGPSGRYLAAAHTDGWIRTWDLEERRLLSLVEGHGGQATVLALRHDEKRFLTGGLDGELRVWNFPPSRALRLIHFSAEPVQALQLLLEGARAQVLAADGIVRRFELEGPTTALMARKVFAHTAAFAPDGERLVTSEEGHLRIRRGTALNGEILQEWAVESPITALDWSANGEWIVAGDEAGRLQLFDPEAKSIHELGSQTGPIVSVTFAPDSLRIASLGVGSAVGIWNVTTRQAESFIAGHSGRTNALAFLGEGKRLVTGGPAGRLRVWDVEDRQLVLELTSWDGPTWTIQEEGGRLWHGTNGTVVERYRDGAWSAHPLPASMNVNLSIEVVPLRSDVNPRFGLLVVNDGTEPVHGLRVDGTASDRLDTIGPWIHTRLEPGETAQLPVYVWPEEDGGWPSVLVRHTGGSESVDLPDDAFEH